MLEITNGNLNMVFFPVRSFFMASMAFMALAAFIICMKMSYKSGTNVNIEMIFTFFEMRRLNQEIF